MAITDLQAAQEMATKYPELHESRQIAFGENYLQDLEQGTGTSHAWWPQRVRGLRIGGRSWLDSARSYPFKCHIF